MASSDQFTGTILKMRTVLTEGQAFYYLKLGEQEIELNSFVGKKISLKYEGSIFCISTGKKIKKSYGQGYSYDAFMKLAECDLCIVKPELCHYAQGTCREPAWGEEHCLKPHVVYLANSSGAKVGITRLKQIPTRWMDQGAREALPLYEVRDRLTAGLLEVEIAKKMADKTDWRKLLKGINVDVDLLAMRSEIHHEYVEFAQKLEARPLNDPLVSIHYPVQQFCEKAVSLDFEKQPLIEGVLEGIKGQYLLFSFGAINLRKFQGYKISFQSME